MPHLAVSAAVLAAFLLGVRHGADPDHLAAIDSLTRSACGVRARLSRFVGTLFAGGHALMVLSIATLAGVVAHHVHLMSSALEAAGAWLSIVLLFAMAAANLMKLRSETPSVVSLRSRLMPKALRNATAPLAAVPIGLLFGLGFETPSQIATYAVALTQTSGVTAGALIGLCFSVGMIVTDTLDSMFVHSLCTRSARDVAQVTRAWIVTVTVLAFGVGCYELACVLGWRPPVADIWVSAALCVVLIATFAWTCGQLRDVDRSRSWVS